jgi:ATP-dependent DNA helicase DinG
MTLEAVLGARGPLAQVLPDFKARPAQQRMAARVAEALEARELLLLEAGTGTGKTYAYLIPALLSGLRVLISTGTRTLQDQLYHRDLPRLAAALGRPARVALLKGRSNYLCRLRLADVGRQAELLPAAADPVLAEVAAWSQATRQGDWAELAALADTHPLRFQLSSTRERCSGSRCPEHARCHVFAARRRALEADIVVVNHHLLLADLALKEEGFGDLLPSVDAVILDEAHQLPDLASEFFGTSVSARQIELLLEDLTAPVQADAAVAGAQLAEPIRMQALAVTRALALTQQRLRSGMAAEERALALDELTPPVQQSLERLIGSLGALSTQLSDHAGTLPELAACAQRAQAHCDALALIAAPPEMAGTRTVALGARGFTLRLLPHDVSQRFNAFIQTGRTAWIFTSATLALGDDFAHFAHRLGLEAAATERFPSPFDYERQALLYLPEGMPDPTDLGFTAACVEAALPLIEAAGGGAFLLFTSHRALRQAAAQLERRLPEELPLLVQGTAPREQLLRQFRACHNAVLLGSASFWEGVDVQGSALRLVVIDRLPFAPPEDPLVRARSAYLRSQGRNPFKEYQLPEAVLALKQGAGRLIRSERDRGVVMVCDPRLSRRSYGRAFLESLPPMPLTRDRSLACTRLAEATLEPGALEA